MVVQLVNIDNDGDMDIVLTELKNQITCWINDGFGKMKFKRVCGNVNAFGIEILIWMAMEILICTCRS